MSHTIKNILIVLVIILLLGGAYMYFFGGKSPASGSALLSSSGDTATAVSAQIGEDTAFLSTLIGVTTIKIDPTLFKSPSFMTLKDNTVSIGQELSPGRPNPFAPIDEAIAESAVISDNSPKITLPTGTITIPNKPKN